jgi:hypothetical protein
MLGESSLPLTMLIAQHPDQFFPFWRGRKAWLPLAWIHFEQQCGAIQVARIAGGSDHICRKGCVLNQICRQSRVGFQTSGVSRVVAKNKQNNVFPTVRALVK